LFDDPLSSYAANMTPYFAGRAEVPNLASLILVPRTLADQWMKQFEQATHRGSFSVIRFSCDQGALDKYLADPKGEFRKAMGPGDKNASKVVIIADQSVCSSRLVEVQTEFDTRKHPQAIAKEAARCFLPTASKLKGQAYHKRVARGEPPKFRPGILPNSTIFHLRFRLLAIDETHTLRNTSIIYQAALLLSVNSCLCIGATATPIFTGPKVSFKPSRCSPSLLCHCTD
jgi:hypothetical protein